MLLTACGSERAVSPAAPASESPATAPPATDVLETVGPEETVVATEPSVTAAATVPVESVDTSPALPTTAVVDESSDTSVVASTASPLEIPNEQVSVTDPIPPQADALTDPAVAEAAVRYAYQHWILIELDPEVRSHIIENGELNTVAIEEGLENARSIISEAGMAVENVSFTDAENAVVLFQTLWQGGPSPIFPDPLLGNAVYQNGTWRLGGSTLCRLAFGAGQDCGSNPQNPTPPTAIELTAVPVGYDWVGMSAPDNVLSVPGSGQWTQGGGNSMTVMVEPLAGLSALTTEDADAVLRFNRFGVGATGVATQVDGRPGVILEHDGGTDLAYIRADDTVVQIHADGLTADEVLAIALGLVPTDTLVTPTATPMGPPGRTPMPPPTTSD